MVREGFLPCYQMNVLSSHPSRLQYCHYHFLSGNKSLLNPAVFYQSQSNTTSRNQFVDSLVSDIVWLFLQFCTDMFLKHINKKTNTKAPIQIKTHFYNLKGASTWEAILVQSRNPLCDIDVTFSC